MLGAGGGRVGGTTGAPPVPSFLASLGGSTAAILGIGVDIMAGSWVAALAASVGTESMGPAVLGAVAARRGSRLLGSCRTGWEHGWQNITDGSSNLLPESGCSTIVALRGSRRRGAGVGKYAWGSLPNACGQANTGWFTSGGIGRCILEAPVLEARCFFLEGTDCEPEWSTSPTQCVMHASTFSMSGSGCPARWHARWASTCWARSTTVSEINLTHLGTAAQKRRYRRLNSAPISLPLQDRLPTRPHLGKDPAHCPRGAVIMLLHGKSMQQQDIFDGSQLLFADYALGLASLVSTGAFFWCSPLCEFLFSAACIQNRHNR